MDRDTAWRDWRRFRIYFYTGASDYIRTDPVTSFNYAWIKGKDESVGTMVSTAPTEVHDQTGSIERGHPYLRTVYDRLRADMSKHLRQLFGE